MTIASILREKGADVVHVAPGDSVTSVLALLDDRGIGAVLVCDDGSVAGVVSERDIVRCLARRKAEVLALTARDVMTAPVITVPPATTVNEAMSLMTDRRIRHLPVVDGSRLAGLVSIGDLVKARIEAAEREAGELKEYITAA